LVAFVSAGVKSVPEHAGMPLLPQPPILLMAVFKLLSPAVVVASVRAAPTVEVPVSRFTPNFEPEPAF